MKKTYFSHFVGCRNKPRLLFKQGEEERAVLELVREKIEAVMDKVDKDGSGMISRKEFDTMLEGPVTRSLHNSQALVDFAAERSANPLLVAPSNPRFHVISQNVTRSCARFEEIFSTVVHLRSSFRSIQTTPFALLARMPRSSWPPLKRSMSSPSICLRSAIRFSN